ncbi:hypothetical protein [Nannocystis punicea]|uniref:ArsR family transcriptional regulator n=1 Tax=Nannocystis punicea TaxID=2995304 RepID=A0ABY7H2B7_9BACT|nr:hypothetical protein [Nannocystis poenicansa]WAS93406.1 hypothetical protein O0S08_45255 [Nannocystis poenicansa]
MQRNLSTGFEDSYRRHLVVEQRKAVLETIARELSPTTTLGDIVDAAQELGWGDAMGELSLGEFAEALLGGEVAAPAAPPAVADAGEVEDEEEEAREDEDEDELLAEDEEEEPEDDDDLSETEEDVAPPPPVAKASKKAKSKASAKKAAKAGKAAKGGKVPTQTALPNIPAAPAKKGAAGGKKLSKKAAKKAAMYVAAMQDDSDAMNLDQAAKLLIPIVRRLKEATMQDLEEQTGMGRRKLRFHIGQLVKHGRLKRHGMGRGTCYTVK